MLPALQNIQFPFARWDCYVVFKVFLSVCFSIKSPLHEQLLSDLCAICICLQGVAKAFFLRGKAHKEVWNEAEARQDFSRVLDLDPGMKKVVKKELAVLSMRMEEKNQEDKNTYKGMF